MQHGDFYAKRRSAAIRRSSTSNDRHKTTMAAPSIEGTYRLVRQEPPGGTPSVPPVLKGMITFTQTFRIFSFVSQDDTGRFYSEFYVARYTLTDTEYAETPEYLIVDDRAGDGETRYDLSDTPSRSPVSTDGGRIRFALPQPFEQAFGITTEFDGGTLRTTDNDQNTYIWEKVH